MNLLLVCNLVVVLHFCQAGSAAGQWPNSEPAADSPKRLELLLRVLKPYLTDWKIPRSLFDVGDRRHFAGRRAFNSSTTDSVASGPMKSTSATSGGVRSLLPGATTTIVVTTVVVTTSVVVAVVGVAVIVVSFLLYGARDAKRLRPSAGDEEAPLLRGVSEKSRDAPKAATVY